MLAVWWMHPLAWVAARHLRVERERACDDLALAFGSRASEYASELVSLAGECSGTEMTLAMARRSQLEGRVMAILNPRVNRDGRTRLATALAAVLVLAIVPMASLRALDAVMSTAPEMSTQQQQPVRVGGAIKEPKKIKHVAPVYPDVAIQAGVQGVVIVEAVIGTDGRVADARVIRPVALLTEAAVDSVLQWQFTPTLLNGQPVEVIMTVGHSHRRRPHLRHPRRPRHRPAMSRLLRLRHPRHLRHQRSGTTAIPFGLAVRSRNPRSSRTCARSIRRLPSPLACRAS